MRTAFLVVLLVCGSSARWTEQKANEWYDRRGWQVGSNFVPSSASNQLEMFQAATWDPVTIDRELGWLQSLGFNSVRVFMHNLLWETDANGFFIRLDAFLELTTKHKINVLAVIFDSCWDGYPKIGKQLEPIPGVHNSRWVQSPGFEIVHNRTAFNTLERYVTSLLTRYRNDKRISMWDLWNEPDNSGYATTLIAPLLAQTFTWAEAVGLSQPVSSGVWGFGNLNTNEVAHVQLSRSDVISFHSYDPVAKLTSQVQIIRSITGNRPLINTEYMARPMGSTFDPNLGFMKSQRISAHNWGSVTGRSQTKYPWACDSKTPCKTEPPVWFHDIFFTNGTAYRPAETAYLRALNHPLPFERS